MPWKVPAMSDVRFALCHAVRTAGDPVAAAARAFAVSRKTAHKWLAVFDALPDGDPARYAATTLADRSRRPHASPGRTPDDVERQVLTVRDRHGWGPRKIHAFLRQQAQRDGLPPPTGLPSVRTLAAVLARHGRVAPAPPAPAAPLQCFERPGPNQLWQVDHKGPVEVERRRVAPLTVIDDHARYCLAFRPCDDKTMATAFAILWDVFADAGLPDAILTDNAFNAAGAGGGLGLSWFDARLIRLGIDPVHGRPYHPQTQGKVERFHGTAVREFLFTHARRDRRAHFDADVERWRGVYNALRPHEALGDRPPVERWRPSDRPRPDAVPEPHYEPGQATRKIHACGEVYFKGYALLVGRGLAGDTVRLEERDGELAIYYCHKRVRAIPASELRKDKIL